jgi:hypothetical protein
MTIVRFSKRKTFKGISFVLGVFLILLGRSGGDNFLNYKKLSSLGKSIFVSTVKADVPEHGEPSLPGCGNPSFDGGGIGVSS